jgi:replicative DNA helicase
MVQTADETRRRASGGAGARVPPHNLEAEESLLGAMLLSRDAIVVAVEARLAASDFYKPAHGHVFESITSLYEQGEPADPVTVAEELRRAGVLEGVGGPAVLISLQARTPAIGNATRYAAIVEEHALLRRLIAVASQIAEMGYSVPDDVLSAIDEAEALVFEVAQRRVTDSMLPIRELLERHLDHIEALYERGQDIIGVPTGYIDLDHQLAGLQPSNLVIIGGRPGTGKALSVDTPVAMPSGWTTMGKLAEGDEVFDEHGQPCRVTFATPVMHGRPCYRVNFDDGSTIVADADHRWFAYDLAAWKSEREGRYRLDGYSHDPDRNPRLARDQSARRKRPRVVTTQQMLDEGVRHGKDQRPNWYIPLTAPLELPEADLPLDPYLLGVWLGDRHTSVASVTTEDPDVSGPSFAAGLAEAGVSRDNIPVAYLRASPKQRLALLRGLLDTDGTVSRGGTVTLVLANRALLGQVRELVCSLGHRPGRIRERIIPLAGGRDTSAWAFRWVPLDDVFRLGRKSERLAASRRRLSTGRATRRAVVSITPTPTVPVRCISVDSPNQMYLAGESMIPTHNTSFSLGIASHAALDGRHPVLVFSLEMSHLELTQRLLCAEARVDATRMRNGKLLETDWPKISHAVGRLAEAPIHIDDNPRLTIMEIRAKARRLKSRQGLGLIVIDYLQLMSGRSSAENRQVEVSEISRGLKILARELEVPVIALSQLSRNLETRADKRPILADLRESGCFTADTRVLRADTGAEVTLGELFVSGERDIPVWSLDEDLEMVPARMNRVFSTGVKQVFELRLASGRSVKATANHPFLTVEGWARLDELKVGSRIAVPRQVPEPTDVERWPDDEVVMLAHLLGDGCFASGQPVHCTSAEPANVLGRFGLDGLRSHEKFIPRQVFALPREQIALFLRHLWATNGSVGSFGGQGRLYHSSTSRPLVEALQQLLLRFEVQSRVVVAQKQGPRPDFHLHVAGAEDQLRFLQRVGIHGERGRRGCEPRPHLDAVTKEPYADSVPLQVLDRVWSGTSNASLLDDPNPERLAHSGVLWDEVTSVVPLDEEPVFDGTVEPTHNFVANGVTSSNSLEQDADVVIFLYRDELYNRDSPDRGTAEVIVAKHRNGPVGVTQLAFLEQYTRFANMARGV